MNNVILIGMPLSGKSTVGRFLSKTLCWKFIDTDYLISESSGEKIADIFSEKGEQYFRLQEKQLIDNLISSENQMQVISTGGGMPIYYDNMQNLKRLGKVIFLDTEINTIIERGSLNNDRPLLKDNYILSLLDLYYTRYNIYKRAHFCLGLNNESVEEVVKKILNLLYLKEE